MKESTGSSVFAGAVYTRVMDLAADSPVPKELKDELKKIMLLVAFAADASLGTLWVTPREWLSV